jgi:hypothetical protein
MRAGSAQVDGGATRSAKAATAGAPSAGAPGALGQASPVVSNLQQRAVDPPALAPSDPEPRDFDPDLGGKHAAEAARRCFPPERTEHTISFGIGLLFAKGEALSRKTYLAPDEPLSMNERRCIQHELIGVSAGAPPTKNSIVEYRFRLRPDGKNEVHASIEDS